MLDPPLYLLAHAASQLLYRWLPPPLSGGGQPSHPSPVVSWPRAIPWPEATRGDPAPWLDLIAAEVAGEPLHLPWLPRFLDRYDAGGRRLAAVVAHNIARLEVAGGQLLTPASPDYPPLLRRLSDPPLALAILGDPAVLRLPSVSVVGSRQASGLAMQASFHAGKQLAQAGYAVVSGGAYGCDIAAHHGALAGRPRAEDGQPQPPVPAICVFAGGLSQLYPAGNTAVFTLIRRGGGILLSERLWDAPSRPPDFPIRNRLIAGLSSLTVVMQAAERSGAMVTARLALDAGREVAALIHPEGDVRACGSNALLADGATPVANAAAIVSLASCLLSVQ
jgi:DNA processing protein